MKIVTLHIGHDFPGGTHYPTTVENVVARALGDAGFSGYTLVAGAGYWEGQPEACTIVTLMVPQSSIETLRICAANLALDLEQDCIMFTVQEGEVSFASP